MRHGTFALSAAAGVLSAVAFTATVSGQPGGAAVQLPEGPGKQQVEATCARCHGLNLITNYWGESKQGWHDLIGTMVALPKEQADTVTTYLATNFPVKPAPAAVVVKGPVDVTIREWLVPTLGSRPRDPLSARDGSFWWAAMYGHRLGRLDLKTGDMKEFPLPEGAGPHGLVDDAAGNVWYTGMMRNAVGVLDPKTGGVKEYKVPEGYRGPHTPVIDPRGMVWFTVQSGAVGRVNPQTGEMKVSKPASSPTYPYGIQINSKGIPWYVDFRGNRVASVNPDTMEITEYTLPNADSRPRRIAITPDDAIWYTDYPRGYIGRFDPATGQVKEWRSPGGDRSRPYGIASTGHVIWYSESGVRPNTLVRFDTRTEQFQTWIIPSGGGIVRHMMGTPDGDVLLACSGVNRVALVDVKTN
jgi:virginiamycin B lyase